MGAGVGLGVTAGLILHPCSPCQIQKRHSSGSVDDRPSLSARDYVESLHQNSRATLLYGKNNVLVQPVSVRLGPDLPRGWLHGAEQSGSSNGHDLGGNDPASWFPLCP